MVDTITPVVHGGSRRSGARALVLHALGATASASVMGAALGLAGALLGAPWGAASATIVVVVVVAYAAREAFGIPVPIPDARRQVPQWWRETFSSETAAALYGLGLGLGFATHLRHGTLVAVAGAVVAGGGAASSPPPRRWRSVVEAHGLPAPVASTAAALVPVAEAAVTGLVIAGAVHAGATLAAGLLVAFSAALVRLRRRSGDRVPSAGFVRNQVQAGTASAVGPQRPHPPPVVRPLRGDGQSIEGDRDQHAPAARLPSVDPTDGVPDTISEQQPHHAPTGRPGHQVEVVRRALARVDGHHDVADVPQPSLRQAPTPRHPPHSEPAPRVDGPDVDPSRDVVAIRRAGWLAGRPDPLRADVGARPSVQDASPGLAGQEVVLVPTQEHVVTVAAVEQIGAAQSGEDIRPGVPAKNVVAGRAGEVLHGHQLVRAHPGGRAGAEVGTHAARE